MVNADLSMFMVNLPRLLFESTVLSARIMGGRASLEHQTSVKKS